MPSSYTSRNRLTLQATGEGPNIWGNILNNGVFDLLDFAADGIVTIAGDKVLTTVNGGVDEARGRVLNITAPATVTIPSVEKFYVVRSVGQATITNGAASVVLTAGEVTIVFTNGALIWKLSLTDFGGNRLRNVGSPQVNTDAATKKYVDDTAFQSVDLPGQAGNAGKLLKTDGANASWGGIEATEVAGLAAAMAEKEDIANRATADDFLEGVASKPLPVKAVWDSAETVVLAFSPSLTLDLSTFINAEVTLTGNVTSLTITNAKPGQKARIAFKHSGAARTVSFPSSCKFVGGIKSLSASSSAVDYLQIDVITPSLFVCAMIKDPS